MKQIVDFMDFMGVSAERVKRRHVCTYRNPLGVHTRQLLEKSSLLGHGQVIEEGKNMALINLLEFFLQFLNSLRRGCADLRLRIAKRELAEDVFNTGLDC